MDKIEFQIQRATQEPEYKVARILINNRDIIDLLKEYELPFAKKEGKEKIAGAYDGLRPDILHRYLLNPDWFDKDDNGKVSVLGCDCTVEDCWPMKVKILESEGTIIWTEFEQPHRKNRTDDEGWDYTGFGQFKFNRWDYYKQLTKLKEKWNRTMKQPQFLQY